MLTQSVPCEDVSSATLQAVRVTSRDEPGVERDELVQQVMMNWSSKSNNCLVNADVTVSSGR